MLVVGKAISFLFTIFFFRIPNKKSDSIRIQNVKIKVLHVHQVTISLNLHAIPVHDAISIYILSLVQ